jgi:hypothetical protein
MRAKFVKRLEKEAEAVAKSGNATKAVRKI